MYGDNAALVEAMGYSSAQPASSQSSIPQVLTAQLKFK